MQHRIVIPVTSTELRDFRIQAINKGTTTPKLARERLFPGTLPVKASAPVQKGGN